MSDRLYKPDPRVLGVILAGGASRRMGGGDKGLQDLGGRPLLAHVIERFAPQVETLILNANGPPDRFNQFQLPIVPDDDDSAQGPLAGVLAAMNWAARARPEIEALATVTSDVPFLPSDLVARLRAASERGLAIAVSSERRHPAIAWWPTTLKDAIAEALQREQRGVNAFAARNNAVEVSFPLSQAHGQCVDPFFNANTPSDLAEARAILALGT
ncbi:MAG TPA: molybdenum cofactor guanylyltransferase MobA [Hyphomicrobium sp.]|nr:molybdenum cofactor guanylyltransferase MobA [Hyphomicrobium sp.]